MNKFKTFHKTTNFQNIDVTICKMHSEIKPETKASAMWEFSIEIYMLFSFINLN